MQPLPRFAMEKKHTVVRLVLKWLSPVKAINCNGFITVVLGPPHTSPLYLDLQPRSSGTAVQ